MIYGPTRYQCRHPLEEQEIPRVAQRVHLVHGFGILIHIINAAIETVMRGHDAVYFARRSLGDERGQMLNHDRHPGSENIIHAFQHTGLRAIDIHPDQPGSARIHNNIGQRQHCNRKPFSARLGKGMAAIVPFGAQ